MEEGQAEQITPWYGMSATLGGKCTDNKDQTQKVKFEGKTIYVTRTQKKWDMGDPSEDLTIISRINLCLD